MKKTGSRQPAGCQGQIDYYQLQAEGLDADGRSGLDLQREVLIYHSQGANSDSPILYFFAPWTNAGRCAFDYKPFRESLHQRVARLVEEEKIPPVYVCAIDLYSPSFGGSQFIDSEFMGKQATFLIRTAFPAVEKTLGLSSAYRCVFGRSSGGYGALRLAMDFPGEVQAVGCHSGDLGFELLYRSDLITMAKALERYSGDFADFSRWCLKQPKLGGGGIHGLMLFGMAAFYSPNLNSPWGFDLPIDLRTGEIDEEVWTRWQAHDPIHAPDSILQRLQQLKSLYIECGNKDQYNLVYGARRLNDRLQKLGVERVFEEFDDNHSGTDYRFDVSLPQLLT